MNAIGWNWSIFAIFGGVWMQPLDATEKKFPARIIQVVSRFHKTKYYSKYLDVILKIAQKFPKAFVILDFISGVYRNFNIAIPPFGIIKQSEHINYFTTASLRNLLGVYFQVEKLYEDPKKAWKISPG